MASHIAPRSRSFNSPYRNSLCGCPFVNADRDQDELSSSTAVARPPTTLGMNRFVASINKLCVGPKADCWDVMSSTGRGRCYLKALEEDNLPVLRENLYGFTVTVFTS